MTLINEKTINEAVIYFNEQLLKSNELKYLLKQYKNEDFEVKYSEKHKAYYNEFIYISPSQLYLYPYIANNILYNDFHYVNNIRFYLYEDNNSIGIEGGINLRLEMSKPPQIKINDTITFEYPKDELKSFRQHHQYLNWHQDMVTTVKNLNEAVDIMLQTMEALHTIKS